MPKTPSPTIAVFLSRHATVLLFILLAMLVLGACAPRHAPQRPTVPDSLAATVVQTARSQIGIPYRRAGNSPRTGFDCSGLVQWVYARHGYSLPRSSKSLLRVGVAVPKHDLRAGDLVFFRIGRSGNTHVGIATGQDSFIHSPKPGQRVREESLFAPYWTQRKIEVRRVL